MPVTGTPPFVLTSATYYGTLAAARMLGRDGVPVVLADPRLVAHTRWSRYVTRRVSLPRAATPDALVERFLELGAASPGMVLYPTSDDLAWLFATHADRLSRHFRLFQPSADVIYRLLNKKRLFELCREIGFDAPETHFPEDAGGVERLARGLPYPVIVKPQTQILLATKVKGVQVEGPEAIVATYRDFMARNPYDEALVRHDPDVVKPMIQAFHHAAAEAIYSVAGFASRAGEVELRASVKILQWPRKIGTGICFGAAPLDPAVGERLAALCRKVGYHGAFEVEFIRDGDRHLLIDFNPRFYGQMGFEAARGLPMANLVHAAACGDDRKVTRLLEASRTGEERHATAFCNRNLFELALRGQRLLGVMGRGDYRRWRAWERRHRGRREDAVWAKDDPVPGIVDFLQHQAHAAHHPRGFLRTLLELGREDAPEEDPAGLPASAPPKLTA